MNSQKLRSQLGTCIYDYKVMWSTGSYEASGTLVGSQSSFTGSCASYSEIAPLAADLAIGVLGLPQRKLGSSALRWGTCAYVPRWYQPKDTSQIAQQRPSIKSKIRNQRKGSIIKHKKPLLCLVQPAWRRNCLQRLRASCFSLFFCLFQTPIHAWLGAAGDRIFRSSARCDWPPAHRSPRNHSCHLVLV